MLSNLETGEGFFARCICLAQLTKILVFCECSRLAFIRGTVLKGGDRGDGMRKGTASRIWTWVWVLSPSTWAGRSNHWLIQQPKRMFLKGLYNIGLNKGTSPLIDQRLQKAFNPNWTPHGQASSRQCCVWGWRLHRTPQIIKESPVPEQRGDQAVETTSAAISRHGTITWNPRAWALCLHQDTITGRTGMEDLFPYIRETARVCFGMGGVVYGRESSGRKNRSTYKSLMRTTCNVLLEAFGLDLNKSFCWAS